MNEDAAASLPETAPKTIPVCMRGFSDAEHAERFGQLIGRAVREISRVIDLERLDGITVAYDYDDALAQLDRGYSPAKPLGRTNDKRLLGVAMAPAVIRDGVVKAHLIFSAPHVVPLEDEGDTPGFQLALHLVAHECGHIADLKARDEAFPGMILQHSYADFEQQLLGQVAEVLWEEYAACRASAFFSVDQTPLYEEGLISVLPGALDRANAAIRSYRLHGNINQVLQEAGHSLCEPLRLAAYLVGHLDGLEADFDLVPAARDMLSTNPYLPFVTQLRDVARNLWTRRGQWGSLAEFEPLHDICREVFATGGLILQSLPDGRLHVAIPFTPQNTP